MTDLSCEYLGFELRSPIVASASPLTGKLEMLQRLEAAGAGAVVLPSLFEEQIVHESLQLDKLLALGEGHAEASGYFPGLNDYNAGPRSYLESIAEAKEALEIPVIASLNGASPGGWARHARLMEDAGADAIELNIYLIAGDVMATATEIELRYLDLVDEVRSVTTVPVAVKLGPYFNSVGNMVKLIDEAGADAVVLFNRFYQPDIDIDEMTVVPSLELSTNTELRLPLRWVAMLYRRVPVQLAATTGIHSAADVIKVLLAGAHVAMLASALLRHGPEYIARLNEDLSAWLDERGYSSVTQIRGSMSQQAVPGPSEFERANYMRLLTGYQI